MREEKRGTVYQGWARQVSCDDGDNHQHQHQTPLFFVTWMNVTTVINNIVVVRCAIVADRDR